jgi:DNA-binding response OmpR family regulator
MSADVPASLRGHNILVVEDNYLLAADTGRVLEEAGALVIGPFPSEAQARPAAESGAVTGAVLDINLGGKPRFTIARLLRAQGVPLIFITGYDISIIPAEFAAVPCLQKPYDGREMISTLASLLRPVR